MALVLKVFVLVFVGTIAVSVFLMNAVHTSEDADPSVNPNLRSEAYFREMAEKNFPHASEGWDDPGLQEEAGAEAGAEAGLEAEAGFDPEEMAEFERQEGHPEGRAADVDGGEAQAASLPADSLYRLHASRGDGSDVDLGSLAGKVSLVVNTASRWGKTGVTFSQLTELQRRLGPKGFQVLAFPSNDFKQEPLDDAGIATFLDAQFPEVRASGVFVMRKGPVNGAGASPVFANLKAHVPGDVPHNFYKYLVDRRGVAVRRFAKKEDPLSFAAAIEDLLRA